MFQEEIPKHKKNTQSNVSKSSKKSNHKHNYISCKFKRKVDWFWKPEGYVEEFGEYCTICGKIGNTVSFLNTTKIQQMREIESTLETFELDSYRQYFVKKD